MLKPCSIKLHLAIYLGTASGKLSNTSNHTYDYLSGDYYNRRRDLIDFSFVRDLV